MLRRILGFGCLTLIVAIGLFVYLLSQTELGQWAAGLLFVYGGAMLGGAILYMGVEQITARLLPPRHRGGETQP